MARCIRRDRRGVAAVEFAMIAPIFLLLLFGTFAIGLYLTERIAVTVATSQGARAAVGALASDNPGSIASTAACAVLNGYAPLLSCSAATITPVVSGTSITVTVTYPLPQGGIFSILPFTLANPTSTSTTQYAAF